MTLTTIKSFVNGVSKIENIMLFPELQTESKWTEVEDDHVHLTSNTKVGIGITAPTEKLSVSGSVKAENFKASQFNSDVLFLSTNVIDGPRISKGIEGSWYNEYKAGKRNDATIGKHIFYTGDGTNWAERVRIDNTGRVGINKSNPAYKLDVVGGINFTGDLRKGGVVQQLGSNWSKNGTKLYYDTNNVGVGTNNPTARLDVRGTNDSVASFKNNDDNDWAYITIGNNTTGVGGAAGFMLGYDNSNRALVRNMYASDMKIISGNAERIRIKGDSYKVGIGTDSPSLDGLHIHQPSTTASHYANLLLTTNATGTSSSGLVLGINDSESALRNYENTPLKFAVNGSDKLIILSDGKVGIGTDDTDVNLHIHQNSTANAGVKISNSDTGTMTNNGIHLFYNSTTSVGARLTNYENTSLMFGTNGTDKMTITNTGRVGINTTSPSLDGLHIHQPSTTAAHYANLLLTTHATGTSMSGVSLGINDSEAALRNYETTPLIFSSGNNEGVRILGTGLVGIGGQTNPQFDLDISGNVNFTGNLTKSGTDTNLGGSGSIKKIHIITQGDGTSVEESFSGSDANTTILTKTFTKTAGTNLLVEFFSSYKIDGYGKDNAIAKIQIIFDSTTNESPEFHIGFYTNTGVAGSGGGGRSGDLSAISYFLNSTACQNKSGTITLKMYLEDNGTNGFGDDLDFYHYMWKITELIP